MRSTNGQDNVLPGGSPAGTASSPAAPADEARVFISPRDLATRWQCSRTQVDRIARRGGLARYCFGSGRNGMVRYLRKEVEAFENKRRA